MKTIKDFVDVKEAAEMLGYHPQSIRERARSGTLKAIRRGRKWFFLKEDIQRELGLIGRDNVSPDGDGRVEFLD